MAAAHVRVHPDSTASGSFSALTFRVPNESDSAGTVKVTVQLPQDTPLIYVSTKPVPGWTAKLTEEPLPKPVESSGTTITKAVRTVTWTAAKGTQIGPGEYQEFSISGGPLPAAGPILFPTEQAYSDGTVVAWDQPTPASGPEPEHPAPAFEITAAEPERLRRGTRRRAIVRHRQHRPGLAGGALAVAVLSLVVALLNARRKVSPVTNRRPAAAGPVATALVGHAGRRPAGVRGIGRAGRRPQSCSSRAVPPTALPCPRTPAAVVLTFDEPADLDGHPGAGQRPDRRGAAGQPPVGGQHRHPGSRPGRAGRRLHRGLAGDLP